MKTVRKDSVTGYKLDFATNTLTINYKFNKALSDFGSPEYNRYKAILADFPNLTVGVVEARGVKCPRCWMHSDSQNEDGLCARCAAVISELDIEL